MRLVFAAGILLSLCATPALADQPIKVSGCVLKGVEFSCLALRSGHKVYNISAVEPRPAPGTFGTVTGTLRPNWVSFCQQGPIISPASFRAGPVLCVKPAKKKKKM
jgi:hypothetical protein